jgi:hypothetical protein
MMKKINWVPLIGCITKKTGYAWNFVWQLNWVETHKTCLENSKDFCNFKSWFLLVKLFLNVDIIKDWLRSFVNINPDSVISLYDFNGRLSLIGPKPRQKNLPVPLNHANSMHI